MSHFQLNPKAKSLVENASRPEVAGYFAAMTPQERASQWINAGNPYRVACTSTYQAHFSANPQTVDHSAMSAYIAASGPAHVIDGWSLLGRAVEALLRNDSYSAIHLAYYAQLRAAMSILASEGIGILNDRHPVVEAGGTTVPIETILRINGTSAPIPNPLPKKSRAQTHSLVWPCLDYWKDLPRASQLFELIFRPGGVSLQSWLKEFGSTVPSAAISQKWMSLWGIDLMQQEDHALRNLASYRPAEFRLPPVPEIHDTLEFVEDIWRCFQPAQPGTFPHLDKHLLRRALNEAGVQLPISPRAIENVAISASSEASWLQVLNQPGESRLFEQAGIHSMIEDPRCHLQVVARAVLLLGIATGSVRLHLKGHKRSDLEFWWHRHGVDRGFWESGGSVDPFELWSDVEESLLECIQWRSANTRGVGLSRWRTQSSGTSLSWLGAFELVGMWGLIP